LSIEEEKDALITRTESAINGLEAIKEKLVEFDQEKTAKLRTEIENTQKVLQEQLRYLENDQFSKARSLFEQVVNQFVTLREIGLEMELNIIKSSEMVTLLTKQTNLILKYEFWLKKIDQAQKDLAEINLESIFN